MCVASCVFVIRFLSPLFPVRRGSVVAMFELSFYRDMAEDPGVNVTSKLVLAVRNGKLGELEVDPGSLTISIYGECMMHDLLQYRRKLSAAMVETDFVKIIKTPTLNFKLLN